MQTLTPLVIERDAARHGFPPLLVADQHAGAVNPDADRRDLAQFRRRVTPTFFLGLHHRPDMRGQILQTGLQAKPAWLCSRSSMTCAAAPCANLRDTILANRGVAFLMILAPSSIGQKVLPPSAG